ncbi:hypothetical protein BCR37DRAFT_343590 [Protomyces lactucae-debilis]|uniref:Anaphase-promoting complex subunit 4-like WD40 domain-containing protein n=1 Tax=Protomyces lactucae-debilis TaxID=2754530 RepID=A0A1Y2FSY8_PROLT|nr:uncharacterized protein BCR37DRAFT_343590 [Protomyces lactucae-debilis]ORY87049.1 hypothetical protein BCR37DRAFT_343590 [Protomyces lactucae-debilis]
MSDDDNEDDDAEEPQGEQNADEQMAEDEDFVDESIQGFFEHKDSVYCLALSPANPNLACSGGGDELAYLWNIETGETVHKLDGHKDSVIACDFSADGTYVATAGMDGLVQVWNTESKTRVVTLEAGSELLWLKFHPVGHVLLAGTLDSTCWMWKVPSGDVMGVFASHTAPCTAGTWSRDGKMFVSVSEDGTVIQWDPRTSQPTHRIETAQDERLCGGEGGWNAVALDASGAVAVVGSSTGFLLALNLASGALIASHLTQTHSIEAITYSPTLPLLAVASVDETIALYEVPSMKLRTVLRHDGPVVALHFEPRTPFLFSASTDKTARKWDVRTGAQVARWRGQQDNILCLAVQAGGHKVLTAGDDGVALVFGESQA